MRTIVLACAMLWLGGCHAHYGVPWDGADFTVLGLTPDRPPGDPQPVETGGRKPAASFPATIATVRLQGGVQPVVVNVRTVETRDDFERIRALPQVGRVVPLSSILCPTGADVGAIRASAAGVGADMVLVYTFQSDHQAETSIPVIGLLTLGIFPNEVARVTSTASAALVDARTGFIYGVAEATAKEARITNAWNVWSATERGRDGAERTAFKKLLPQLAALWAQVIREHAGGAG